MDLGQKILIWVGSGQVNFLWLGLGQVRSAIHGLGFEFGKFTLKISNFSIFSLQVKKISLG